MDGKTFDELIKGLRTRRVTRLRALQGMAAATMVGLTGGRLATEGTAAADRNRRDRLRNVCHCGDNNPQQVNCVTKRLEKEKVQRHLDRHRDDYKGRCRRNPSVGCGPANMTQGSCPPGQLCNNQANCVPGCTGQNGTPGSCPGGQVCNNGQCQGQPLGCNPANNTQGSCAAGQLCNTNANCVPGCTGQTGTLGSCPGGQACINGQCQGQPTNCSPANNTQQGSCLPGQICSNQSSCVAGCTGGPGQGSCPPGQQCRGGFCS